VKIAVDLMGGEGSGYRNLRACMDYPAPEELVLVGEQNGLDSASVGRLRERGANFLFCSKALTGLETPRTLLKHSKNTSLAIAMNLLAEGRVDAVVSSADTKAIMVLGRSCIGIMEVIRRPAIAKAFQGPKGQFYMLDLGANVRCSPELLQQFARLGCALQAAHQTQSENRAPRVALLNIGREAGKGTSDVNTAARLIEADHTLHSVGFIEPNELFSGRADVIVCDGYAGNLVLKTIESMASYLRSQLAQLPSIDSELQNLTTHIDPDRYNGALLAGLKGIVVKSHGSASERGFLHALLQGRDYIEWNMQRVCEKSLAS
jgi:glycerol-3-phosphate acyltransferase PlsX